MSISIIIVKANNFFSFTYSMYNDLTLNSYFYFFTFQWICQLWWSQTKWTLPSPYRSCSRPTQRGAAWELAVQGTCSHLFSTTGWRFVVELGLLNEKIWYIYWFLFLIIICILQIDKKLKTPPSTPTSLKDSFPTPPNSAARAIPKVPPGWDAFSNPSEHLQFDGFPSWLHT